MNTINDRIHSIRAAMKSLEIDAYIIPSSDAHQSEYVADYAAIRQYISGFDGSAGTVVITENHAGLWTDSRYFIQAEEQLSDNLFELHKLKNKGFLEPIDWLVEHLDGTKIALDGLLFSKKQVELIQNKLKPTQELLTNVDLIPSVWKDRPSIPQHKIYEHPVEYAIETRDQKIQTLRKSFEEQADAYLITALDDIAWLLNLRGSDVEFNPLFIAYAIVEKERSLLFTDAQKIDTTLLDVLTNSAIQCEPYESIIQYLNEMPAATRMMVSEADINYSLYRAINGELVAGPNHIRTSKAIKSAEQLGHIRNAMEKDGVALLRTFKWLEETLETTVVKETEVAKKLAFYRSQQADYIGESFGAIVGFAGNGAIVHYSAKEETCAEISKNGMLLVDSGGQYMDGTTDVTRTMHFGTPSKEEKEAFTLVLKGFIAVNMAVYPYGTRGVQLDALARFPLWQHSMNYGHGTGHGVGYLLNVHEGPHGFSSGIGGYSSTIVEPGMITSNEPGFYKADAFGIRIENLVVAQEHEENDFGRFLKHESLTYFPIEWNLIQSDLLTRDEIQWLDDYHAEVYRRLAPRITSEEQAWLAEKCRSRKH